MKAILALFLLVATLASPTAPLPESKPIITAAELQTAAQEVPVGKIDFAVPSEKEAVESALSKRFFNQPEEHRYAKLTQLGFTCIGGDNDPYIRVNTGRDSWEFFDLLLSKAQVVCTPGAGFGKCGEGHVRISAFNYRENVTTALTRIAAALK